MIVSFGSLNADLIFTMPRPPLAGETLPARDAHMEAGGKGANQAVAAARAGAEVAMIGAVGRDDLADMVLRNLAEANVDLTRIARVDGMTGCASIIVDDHGRNQIVVAAGANGAARSTQVEDALLRPGTRLLLQMETPVAEVEALLHRARAAGAISILNLAPAVPIDLDALRLVDLLVVNEHEAEVVAGWLGVPSDAASLAAALGTGVLRTLGDKGAEAVTAEGSCFVPAVALTPVDTTAAGDCFVGVLAASLDAGHPFATALHRATAAAALCCLHRGSQSSLPWRTQIEDFATTRAG